ncbi:mechanosensitive ion channel family protein [Williamsia sterculiae]|uniref:Small conductance mechanosensitive channel n=1 Tax=Williamsia sterculiae TaxID=1344003 RepID=A0A1N7FVN8_9NOCA|nr:mechanosensitive ion channel family protein [Williamsia sterculiae]SIS04359.1 small conductance mechanosensitive channel [Williamsia sterculiae]
MVTRLAASPAGVDTAQRWLALNGLNIVLWLLGAALLIRLINWSTARILRRIDQGFQESDELVRSEATKHRHALAQVFAYVAIGLVCIIAAFYIVRAIGVPISGFAAPATVLGAGLGFGAQRVVQDFLAGFFVITEKQYGFGDVVELALTGGTEAEGTVEDVTLRVTKLRNTDGEVLTIPNGQIVKATNLSKDWARAVVDIPLPVGSDITRVTEELQKVGAAAFADPRLEPLLLDEPTPMGVTDVGIDSLTIRIVARTLPGKQFEVARSLRARIVRDFARARIALAPSSTMDTTELNADAEEVTR